MDDALRRRIDAGLVLLASNTVLLLVISLRTAFEATITIGLLAFAALVGYALYASA